MSEVEISQVERIGWIRLNAPATLNSVDSTMLSSVADAVLAFDADPQVRAIAVTGTGRGFCSGARLSSDTVDTATLDAVGRAIRAIVGGNTPVVAVVNGIAAGVGMSLALAADYTVAADNAAFMLAFSRIALMPDGGATALVAASIGRARAMRLALTAEKISAATALEWGLIADVCPAAELDERAQQIIEVLAGSAPRAVALTKHAINEACLPIEAALLREEAGQSELLGTADFAEGVAAFNAKRPATFTGR